MEFPSPGNVSPSVLESRQPRLSFAGGFAISQPQQSSTTRPPAISLSHHSHVPTALRPGWSPPISPQPPYSTHPDQSQPLFPVPQIPGASSARLAFSDYRQRPSPPPIPPPPPAMQTALPPPPTGMGPTGLNTTDRRLPPIAVESQPYYGSGMTEGALPSPTATLPHYANHINDERIPLSPHTGVPTTIMMGGPRFVPHSQSPRSSRPSSPYNGEAERRQPERRTSHSQHFSAHYSDSLNGALATSPSPVPSPPQHLPNSGGPPQPGGFSSAHLRNRSPSSSPSRRHASISSNYMNNVPQPPTGTSQGPSFHHSESSSPLPPSPPMSASGSPRDETQFPMSGPSTPSSNALRTSIYSFNIASPPPVYEPNPAIPTNPGKPSLNTAVSETIPEEEDDGAMRQALALSARQAEEEQRLRSLSEEEQLALALAESLKLDSGNSNELAPAELEALTAASVTSHGHPPSSVLSHSSFATSDTSSSGYNNALEDQDWARRTGRAAQQMAEDEAFARALLEEEQRAAAAVPQGLAPNRPPGFVHMPYSEPVVSTTSMGDSPVDKAALLNRHRSAGAVQTNFPALSYPQQGNGMSKPRSSSVGAGGRPATMFSQISGLSPMSAGAVPPGGFAVGGVSGQHLPSLGERDEEQWEMPNAPLRAVSPLPPSDEMLMGVSLGFGPPPISTFLTPLSSPFPNVMALPYGKCPPLHIQAISWRHILQLMARMASSRIEPTVEAMAARQHEPHRLRTVIQFVKVHRESPDWRTVLYFTLDYPVPQNMSSGTRMQYINNNTHTLPYSYTLGTVPAILRTGSPDNHLSKVFVVPSTERTPYPTLPIDLPNLMTYLNDVLEMSRQAVKDNPIRRLSQMVSECYPEGPEPIGVLDDPDSRSGRFKKWIPGKFRKNSGNKNAGGNSDRYDLITPFIVDDAG